MSALVVNFFANSEDILDYVLKPLEHIRGNWDVIWDRDNDKYQEEEDSFGAELNALIHEIAQAKAPTNYHVHEDKVAVFQTRHWDSISKKGRFWVGGEYREILEQGSFDDHEQQALVLSVAGRVKAALDREQYHIDEMEKKHKRMLCAILSIILYQRF
ncbi:MAG: hypothetical protein D3903_15865 [Candidatus Electrothrix sp. GM3_4]|nr:hypothetical protein [Candidatus Electrothrix sp. GM3_4]